MANNRYCIDYAKRVAGCKKCKQSIEKGLIRIAKVVPNAFSDDGGDMKQWYHVACIFEQLSRARATTKKIEDPGDLDGWDNVEPEDKKDILARIKNSEKSSSPGKTPGKKKQQTKINFSQNTPNSVTKKKPNIKSSDVSVQENNDDEEPSTSTSRNKDESPSRDDTFREFRRLCAQISEVSSYLEKTKIISDFFKKGTSGKFTGDLHLWVKMLLPAVAKRVYNLQSKQLIKLFSQIFGTNQEDMLEDLEQGDIAETIRVFFEQSEICESLKKSKLTMQDVDKILTMLSQYTKEEDQLRVLTKAAHKCTGNDLKMIVRLIKHDLRINAGPKHVLEALHSSAYEAFQASRNIDDVVDRILEMRTNSSVEGFHVKASLMTPVLPMLAEACRSVDYAFKKCPNGMYAEIKYDGERVQVHKEGDKFSYFSRSLKPVLPHKVQHLKEFIPKAFEFGNDLILDSEVLLIDTETKKPLPFGTLGKHKKEAFKGASVCLFVFDCLHYNGENLINKPIAERRKTLQKIMKEVPNHVVLSEMMDIETKDDLKELIDSVISQGLEGLVLKDKKGKYEPGKRHWLKIKKDYLEEGAIADSADLVVLGAYFGTGNKGGMMSIFLMGCLDKQRNKWCTVTKVHGGHDDATLDKLQKELHMTKISRDASKVPAWLDIKKPLVPDFICKDPKNSQIWEITGAEFSKAEIHTAAGISIRFPRVTKIRTDKTWKEATSLQELMKLYENSKQTSEFTGMKSSNEKIKRRRENGENDQDTDEAATPQKKTKLENLDPSPSSSSPKSDKVKRTVAKKNLNFSSTFNSKEDRNQKTLHANSSVEYMFPNIFTGVKLCIPKSVKKNQELTRYFVAYDGDLLQSYEIDNATHAIAGDNDLLKGMPKNVVVVTENWLWDSIKNQKRMNEASYSPT